LTPNLILLTGRLRELPKDTRDLELFESRQFVIRGLIEMRKAGLFRMVYCDADKLAIVLPSAEDLDGKVRQKISWTDALLMVEKFRGLDVLASPLSSAPCEVESVRHSQTKLRSTLSRLPPRSEARRPTEAKAK
jgi:hypothetical protein